MSLRSHGLVGKYLLSCHGAATVYGPQPTPRPESIPVFNHTMSIGNILRYLPGHERYIIRAYFTTPHDCEFDRCLGNHSINL